MPKHDETPFLKKYHHSSIALHTKEIERLKSLTAQLQALGGGYFVPRNSDVLKTALDMLTLEKLPRFLIVSKFESTSVNALLFFDTGERQFILMKKDKKGKVITSPERLPSKAMQFAKAEHPALFEQKH